MATQSIKKNIVIHDKDSAAAFVEALEKAAAIATKPASRNYSVKELKVQKISKLFSEIHAPGLYRAESPRNARHIRRG